MHLSPLGPLEVIPVEGPHWVEVPGGFIVRCLVQCPLGIPHEAPFPLGMQEGLVGLSITASKKNATAPALVVAAPRNFANCHWPRGNTEWHP